VTSDRKIMDIETFKNIWDDNAPAIAKVLRQTPPAADFSPLGAYYQTRSSALHAILATIANDYGFTYDPDLWLLTRDVEMMKQKEIEAHARRVLQYTTVDRGKFEIVDSDRHLLRINAPMWYEDTEFLVWLNSPETATFHRSGSSPSSASDAFFTVDTGGQGSDYPGNDYHPGIPDHIWQQALLASIEVFGDDTEVLIWVSNIPT
jgi:hypothetical protein